MEGGWLLRLLLLELVIQLLLGLLLWWCLLVEQLIGYHACILRYIEELLLLLLLLMLLGRQNLLAVLSCGHMMHLVVLLRLRRLLLVDGYRLWSQLGLCCSERSLTSLRVQTERLVMHLGLLQVLHMLVRRGSYRCLVLLCLLGLLLDILESLLENLHNMITFLFFVYKLFVENLIKIRDGLFNFREHLLELSFEFRHDLTGHCLFELVVNYLSHRCICQLR